MRNLLLGSALIISIFGCNSDKVIFEEVGNVPDGKWAYGDVYDYSFQVEDTSEAYRLLLYLDFSTGYDWQNFYTRVVTTYPNDTTIQDILSLELATKTGEWYGDCNSKHCELNIPMQENVRFPEPGKYSISFEQFMREEIVEGINAIGLKLIVPAKD